ncbi:MATE family efflux transporter [Fusobacterium sp. PH5-44]|uniref:MATE family efflux transporter n=1 Tax=unclassified Fusobacterium TaxID=2648384 RepID=UPI003D1F3DAE
MNNTTIIKKENKMGTMPINKLIINMSIPIVISMLIQALYNIIDSIFVAKIDENALTAVSMAFPIQNLMIALGSGLGVGVNACLSRDLGAKKFKSVNKIAMQGVLLASCSFVLFFLFGLFFTKYFMSSQTNNSTIIQDGSDYLKICSFMSFGIFFQITFERLLQATGKSFYSMICQVSGAITNIILDPILIFGLFGMPAMGVKGAAIATVIGQILSALLGLYFNINKNKEIVFHIRNLKPNFTVIKTILTIGIPSVLMASIISITTFVLNKILITFTPTAVAVFGVYFKLQSFIMMPVYGLNSGVVPIIAYNYGANNPNRIKKTYKLAITYACFIMILGLFTFQIIPETLLLLFNASQDMIAIGKPALRIISFSFLFAGFCIVTSSVFQALGRPIYSLISAVVRQLVFLVPCAYLLSKFNKLELIWFSFLIAEVGSVIMALYFLKKIRKSLNL